MTFETSKTLSAVRSLLIVIGAIAGAFVAVDLDEVILKRVIGVVIVLGIAWFVYQSYLCC